MVDVPIELLGGVLIAVIGLFGTILIFMAKSIRQDFKEFSDRIEKFQEGLAKNNLVTAKLLLIHEACPNCPKLDIDMKESLGLVKADITIGSGGG